MQWSDEPQNLTRIRKRAEGERKSDRVTDGILSGL